MSCFRELCFRFAAPTVAVLALVVGSGDTVAVGIHDYQLTRSFALPTPGTFSGGNVLFDALPDGRLLALNGPAVSVESAPKSGTFTALGTIPGFAPSFGPSFLAVSPDGTRAAAGSNGGGSVVVFDTGNPTSATSHAMQDFSGEWFDNRYLAVANFTSGSTVQILDTNAPSVTTVINNIGGFSAGISFDAAGNLYTGNATDTAAGGSSTGWVKAFSAASWQNALTTSTPLNFETSGSPIVDLLTAYPIGFDNSGNMFAGGGDFYGGSGDYGYAALVDAAAIASALASPQSSPPIAPASSTAVLRKFASPPATIDSSLPPGWAYNAATGELYLNYIYGNGTVDVYSAVPEPAGIVLLVIGGLALVANRGRRS